MVLGYLSNSIYERFKRIGASNFDLSCGGQQVVQNIKSIDSKLVGIIILHELRNMHMN